MGLDICLIKPCLPEEADASDWKDNGFKTTRNPKIVRNFPQFIIKEEDEEYDYAALGHPEYENDDYWETHGWYMTDDKMYVMDSPKHSGSGPESCWDYIKKNLEKDGIEVLNIINLEDIPTKKVIYDAIPYKEVGYQRKGANQKFYEDGKWEDPDKCVVTKEELEHDIKEYFSSETPDSEGGWGSFTEYHDLSDDERYQRFIENIGSKFIEGENAVMYW